MLYVRNVQRSVSVSWVAFAWGMVAVSTQRGSRSKSWVHRIVAWFVQRVSCDCVCVECVSCDVTGRGTGRGLEARRSLDCRVTCADPPPPCPVPCPVPVCLRLCVHVCWPRWEFFF